MLNLFPPEVKKGYVLYKEGKLQPDFIGDTSGWYLLDIKNTVKFNLDELYAEEHIAIDKDVETAVTWSMLKNVRFTAMTPDFWNACDAVGGPAEWKLWGIPVCGKGEPGQIVHVGHGSPPVRFRNIQVLGG